MENRFETFTVLVNRINRNIRRIKNLGMAEYDLRSAHISCLHYLYSWGALNATELCEKCDEDKATVSRALDHLEKNGYLTCEKKGAKRYKSPLKLTEKGELAGRRISDEIAAALDELNSEMTDSERVEFYRCLSALSERLEAIADRTEQKRKE